MFNNIQIEENPPTLVRKDNALYNDFTFKVVTLDGEYYRVIPETAREVFFLQSLTKGYNIHVPESGDGVIVNKISIDTVKHLWKTPCLMSLDMKLYLKHPHVSSVLQLKK